MSGLKTKITDKLLNGVWTKNLNNWQTVKWWVD
jgi:hypothetical protein